MNKLYLMLAGLLVLNASSPVLLAQGGEEAEPRKHEHWPPRGRLRQSIHEARTGEKEENRSRRSLLGRCKGGACKDENRRRREQRHRERADGKNKNYNRDTTRD